MTDDSAGRAVGDWTGLALPATVQALGASDAAWFTQAFRAFGSLSADEEVLAIARCEPAGGGNSGQKAIVDLVIGSGADRRTESLFVKFSRDLSDPFRDRRRDELEAEVRLARLARHPAFPVKVAKAWFADFEGASGTGLLISSTIAFGQAPIEPIRRKCRDSELPDAQRYYEATLRALARLAAADQTGALAPEIDALFPYDARSAAADQPFDWPEERLNAAFARLTALLAAAPHLFPAEVRAPSFLAQFQQDVRLAVAHETQLRRFLQADPRLIALTHWNTNLDNAWFERAEDGGLVAGLLDWGMVRRMNIAYGIWGGLSAAEPDMLARHTDRLLGVVRAEHAACGAVPIPRQVLSDHFDLSLALLGTALLLDAPALLLSRRPDLADLSGSQDPRLAADGVVEGFLKVFTNMLVLWHHRRIGRTLEGLRDA
ncbi:MAG: hypothetical protein ACKOPQ_06195 [Novosphingobium sp.]